MQIRQVAVSGCVRLKGTDHAVAARGYGQDHGWPPALVGGRPAIFFLHRPPSSLPSLPTSPDP